MLRDYNRDVVSSSRGRSSKLTTSSKQAWHRIYTGFIRGPHFKSWFRRKAAEQCEEIRTAARLLRLDYPGDMLIRQTAPKMYQILKDSELQQKQQKQQQQGEQNQEEEKNDGTIDEGKGRSKHAVPRREIMSLVRLWVQIKKEMRRVLKDGKSVGMSKGDVKISEEFVAMTMHLRAVADVVPRQFLNKAEEEEDDDDDDDDHSGEEVMVKELGKDDEHFEKEKEEETQDKEEDKQDTQKEKQCETQLSGKEAVTATEMLNHNPSMQVTASSNAAAAAAAASSAASSAAARTSSAAKGFSANRKQSSGFVSPPPLITPSIVFPAPEEGGNDLESFKKTPTNMFLGSDSPPTVSPRTKDTRRKVAASFAAFWPEDE